MRHPAWLVLLVPLTIAAPRASGAPHVDLDALAERLARENPEIPTRAVQKAFGYLKTHYVENARYVAIVNFDLPSNAKRLAVISLKDGEVEHHYVAHGEGSGGLYATEFSDEPRSHQSSLGLYLTGEEYEGKHGRSLKLRGLEGSNNMAESRAVVIHAADYVSRDYIRDRGMAGRSWGCPAVDPADLDELVGELRGGAVLLLYHS
ncbi:MAG: murein L,D-transpeptidase catalytic domain family protein [Elusimicrobia bacterium]|nr:murein L,D-transpeptidase catalytic domain family protein [Elusimicrobiota bacterium]